MFCFSLTEDLVLKHMSRLSVAGSRTTVKVNMSLKEEKNQGASQDLAEKHLHKTPTFLTNLANADTSTLETLCICVFCTLSKTVLLVLWLIP